MLHKALIRRYYQQEALDAIHNYFATGGKGNPLIVMPTGTGKAFCIADFIKDTCYKWPGERFMMLVHNADLVEQNAKELMDLWPGVPIGINSDTLKVRDYMQPIIFAGIASVYKSPEIFGHRDVIVIDEAHMISPDEDTMYQQFIEGLRKINPKLIVVGYTATWFRAKQGLLTDWTGTPEKPVRPMFDDIIYNIADTEGFVRLINEGYLSKPIPIATKTEIDLTGVRVTNKGEFNLKQLEAVSNQDKITIPALQEAIERGQDRNCWLCFASGIDHAERIAELLNQMGITAATYHSKNSDAVNKANMEGFKAAKIKCIVNYGKLTTGFNWPPVDMIIMLRATNSVVLWIQMLGRGTRPYDWWNEGQYKPHFNYTKFNCLVLDFARNRPRLGPINDPVIPKPKGKGGGDQPTKVCGHCGAYNHPSARYCDFCGEEFEFQEKITKYATEADFVVEMKEPDFIPVLEVFAVDHVLYSRHVSKKSGGVSFRVDYQCGWKTFTEYISVENEKKNVRHLAGQWWNMRTPIQLPTTAQDCVNLCNKLKEPSHITVRTNLDHPKIVKVEFNNVYTNG